MPIYRARPRPYILHSGFTPGRDGFVARRGIADGSLIADGLQEIAQVN